MPKVTGGKVVQVDPDDNGYTTLRIEVPREHVVLQVKSMTANEAKAKWSDACTVVELKGTIVRDGNWTSLERALRHCSDTSTVVEKSSLNGDVVVQVTPAPKETAEGKTPMILPPFLLVVK